MADAQVQVVEVPGAIQLSREQVCLSEGGFAALELTVPDDFGRPGARTQVLFNDGESYALFTVAAVLPGDGLGEASVAMGDPDRLFAGSAPSATVVAMTDVFAAEQLAETVTTSGDVAVIAPHGGAIERQTDDQAAMVAADPRLDVDLWVCLGRGADQFRRLHITSDDISEHSFPGFSTLLGREHRCAVSFHGFNRATKPGTATALDVIVGGQFDLDRRYDLADRIRHRLPPEAAFEVYVTTSCGDPLAGLSPRNAVNRLSRSRGIQIEQSGRLRRSPDAPRLVAEAVVEALLAWDGSATTSGQAARHNRPVDRRRG
jgi:phage replication-related protein YjqB (UPF0714/DUF867 family)